MSSYDETIMTKEDQAKIKSAQDAYKKALAAGDKSGMSAAHERAEAIRKAYGYSGGADGSGYTQIEGYEGAETLNKAGESLNSAYAGLNDLYKQQAEAQKKDIDAQTEDALRQAYISNMQSQKGVDQSLRASGITGGLSETVRAGMSQNYHNNRASVQKAAVEAKKDIDLNTNSALAQNEVNRANAQYSSDVTKAQFQQTAAEANRNVEYNKQQLEMNKQQLELSRQQQDMSKYLTFIQNGLVDENNAKEIASSLGISESALIRASKAAQNADSASIALNLLSAGVYDDSFVDLLGGRFSAETLKNYVKIVKSNFKTSSNSDSGSSGAEYSAVNDPEVDADTKEDNRHSEFTETTDLNTALKNIGFTNEDWVDFVRKNGYFVAATPQQRASFAREMGTDGTSFYVWTALQEKADREAGLIK